MTKNRRNRRPRKGGRNNSQSLRGGVSPVAFHSLNTFTTSGTTGVVTAVVTPQGTPFAGVNEVGDQFDLFRVSRLRYRLHPMDPTDTVNQGVCFYPDVDIQTQTISQLAESPLAAVQTPFCGVPSRWINVPRSQLKGMLDWYKCTQDAGSTEFEIQGSLQMVGGLSSSVRLEVEGIILFKNPVSSSLQMERTLNRAVAKGLAIRLPPPPSPVTVKNVTPRGN